MVAEDTGVPSATLRRYAKKAEVYDMVAEEHGDDSEEARAAMTLFGFLLERFHWA